LLVFLLADLFNIILGMLVAQLKLNVPEETVTKSGIADMLVYRILRTLKTL